MVGNIWQVMHARARVVSDEELRQVLRRDSKQFTDTYSDGHTRSQLLKGGSYYRPSGSDWYFRHCIGLRTHNKYVRKMYPPLDFVLPENEQQNLAVM